jgi:guanylate kinase
MKKEKFKPLILLVGKSGTGKNYLCQALMLNSIPSYTTRTQRKGELDGVEHFFTDMKEWELFSKSDQTAAWTCYNGNYYWSVKNQIENYEYDVYIIDPDGVESIFQYKENMVVVRDFEVVYFKASILKRIKNMRKRKDSWSSIIERIINDHKAFKEFEKIAKEKYSAKVIEV